MFNKSFAFPNIVHHLSSIASSVGKSLNDIYNEILKYSKPKA